MLISFLVGCPGRSPYLTDLTEEANPGRANSLPMPYALDLRTDITFLLELDVSGLLSDVCDCARYNSTSILTPIPI
jgi:hypothetical protein